MDAEMIMIAVLVAAYVIAFGILIKVVRKHRKETDVRRFTE